MCGRGEIAQHANTQIRTTSVKSQRTQLHPITSRVNLNTAKRTLSSVLQSLRVRRMTSGNARKRWRNVRAAQYARCFVSFHMLTWNARLCTQYHTNQRPFHVHKRTHDGADNRVGGEASAPRRRKAQAGRHAAPRTQSTRGARALCENIARKIALADRIPCTKYTGRAR